MNTIQILKMINFPAHFGTGWEFWELIQYRLVLTQEKFEMLYHTKSMTISFETFLGLFMIEPIYIIFKSNMSA